MTGKPILTLALALAPLIVAAQPAPQGPTVIGRPGVESCPAVARERLERVARTAGATSQPDAARRLGRARAQVIESEEIALMLRCIMLRQAPTPR